LMEREGERERGRKREGERGKERERGTERESERERVRERERERADRLAEAHLVGQNAVDVSSMQRPQPVQPHLGIWGLGFTFRVEGSWFLIYGWRRQ